jgi:hypothetical protein
MEASAVSIMIGFGAHEQGGSSYVGSKGDFLRRLGAYICASRETMLSIMGRREKSGDGLRAGRYDRSIWGRNARTGGVLV